MREQTMPADLEDLMPAVNALVTSPDAQTMYNSMLAVANLAKLHPVGLQGTAAVLNPLMKLRNENQEVYDRVLALVEQKRALAGFEPLERPIEDKYDKTEYMRNFMDAKRQRQRRAVEIENMVRAEADRLIGKARLEFMDNQSNRWKKSLDERLEAARIARGGRLPREQLDAIRERFWAEVDERLEELEVVARREQLKPPHLRQKVQLP